ncbi:MAG: SusF/SusE family outer membrane protein [Bacteroidales bacterium]|nr:SusF/SusE family outer membrane protein [Bacteroidales bacterium]
MKITKYFLSLAAAAGMIAGCQKPEMIQIAAPEDVKAPVLEEIQGPIEITPSNMALEKVTFAWSAADYGVATQVNYSLEAATAAAPAKVVTITSGLTTTSAELTYDVLNQILFNDLELADGVAEDVVFKVGAKVGEYEKIYSNAITVSCKVTAAEKVYPKLTVAGSYAYNNWTPGKGQFVFDFEGTDVQYSGVIDFGEDVSALNFKFVGEAWGNNEFSVPSGEAQAAEAAELPLVAGGGDNIAAYTTHRFYSLTLDKSAPKVIKNFSFNSLGVIGDATSTGWDADTDMQFNTEKQRFYVDVTLADGTIKFRANDAWDVNWGGADGVLVANGDNIPVSAGDYRIYVNLNDPANPTYELNASMFGKDEPTSGGTTEPEPPVDEPVQLVGWGIVGGFTGWADGADVMLASDGTYLVAKGVALEGELKFRKDGAWGTNFGYAEGATFEANAEIALAQDGGNIVVPAGTYDVYLDEANAKAWFINDGSYPGGGAAPVAAEWGLIGSLAACNNWGNNVVLYVEGDYSVAKNVAFAAGDQFKFRKGEAWGVELTYEGQISIDARLDLIDGTGGKQNSSIAEGGNFDVYLANDLSCFYVMTPGKTPADAGEAQKVYTDPSAESFVVGFSGSVLGWDDPAFETNDRAAFVSKNVTDETTFAGTYEFKLEGLSVAAGDEFKVRINGQWIGVGGATVEGLAVSGTDNFIADQAGTYTAVITFAWDGGNYSDVKVVFTSEATELPTPDAKQWAFNWTAMGMGDMAAVLDFGVAIPGQCVVAYDPAIMGAPEGTPYQIFNMIGYKFEAVDATSGKLTLISTNMFGEEITQEFTYSNLTETSCYFTFGEDSFIAQDADATLTEVAIDTTGGVM